MAGHAQQLGQVDGQEAQKGEGPDVGLGWALVTGRRRKREEVPQLGGTGPSPAASCRRRVPPALKWGQKLFGGLGPPEERRCMEWQLETFAGMIT